MPSFQAGAGGEAGAPPVSTTGGTSAIPGFGEACTDDAECDDELDCTDDACDPTLARCRFTPRHERCADETYCNGVELCELGVGCGPGVPVACSDGSSCTIDVCIEASRSCESRPRDGDGDGDPVHNCGGGDCADTDPNVHSGAVEVCDNQKDDDCDGTVDGPDCVESSHDTCADPRTIEAPGSYELSLAAATEDVAPSCSTGDAPRRDVVVALVVPEGGLELDLTAGTDSSVPMLSLVESCTDSGSELACAEGVLDPDGERGYARLVLRDLPPDTYPLFVSSTGQQPVELTLRYREASDPYDNDTCENARPLVPDENQVVLLSGASADLESACGTETRELVYRFEVDETSDVEVSVFALDDYGLPLVSLRDAGCAELANELGCRRGSRANLFARALEPGTYYVAVGSSGPSELDLRVSLLPPSEPGPDEGCDGAPALLLGQTLELDLERSPDRVDTGCLPGAPDATYALELGERSDVLLVARTADGDYGAVSLSGPSCSAEETRACGLSERSPVRAVAEAVPAGEYRVVAESALGAPMTLTAFTRPAQVPVLVPFADTCDGAVSIPETGGRFLGNTSNAEADYDASCDFGSGAPGGAPEQMLSLVLERERRVVFDLRQSEFATLLAVRAAGSCPGPELERACAPGYVEGRSFLDRVLPAGEYWVQVDGYDRQSGNWILDVFVADP